MAPMDTDTDTETRGGAREGAGRPPLAARKRRGNPVKCTFTDAELAKLQRAAKRAGGIPLATFIARAAIEASK